MSKIKEFKTEVYISLDDDGDDGEYADPLLYVECVTFKDGIIRHETGLEEKLYHLFGEDVLVTITATRSENNDEWQGLH